MERFQVLSRHQKIDRNCLLEASAGTGKTFSIENIVVRLLIEMPAMTLEKILIVTFTKAATRDLKLRVRKALLFAIQELKNNEFTSEIDYLSKVIEEGAERKRHALRNLERALSQFDQAQIFTIHGFCAQMLSENLFECGQTFQMSEKVEPTSVTVFASIIRDYFRSDQMNRRYSPAQLKSLLKSFSGRLDLLEKKLLEQVEKGLKIVELPYFEELFFQFQETISRIKQENDWDAKKLHEDLLNHTKRYNKLTERATGNLKPELISLISEFVNLFEKEKIEKTDFETIIENQLAILDLFDPSNLKAKAPPIQTLQLHYPRLLEILTEKLKPFVNVKHVFARLAEDCRQLITAYKEKLSLFGYDDLLVSMQKALKQPSFLKAISTKYRAAIIDEFQDTDPIQWNIFRNLFLDNPASHSILYLVGDPKQSIYAFRQADIYTYLDAANRLGKENHYSLDTNFRSHFPLVEALNFLFSEQRSPGLFSLPQTHSEVCCPEVKSSQRRLLKNFSDNKGSVHFVLPEMDSCKKLSLESAEEMFFLPFIANEILQLKTKDSIDFGQFAILVADRFQAERIAKSFQKWNIPVNLQKNQNLKDSPAFSSMREILQAVCSCKDASAVKTALGGRIIGWSHQEILALETSNSTEKIFKQFVMLNEEFQTAGFASFFQMFLTQRFENDGKTLIESILSEESGSLFFQDLLAVSEYILEWEAEGKTRLEDILSLFKEVHFLQLAAEKPMTNRLEPSKNAVFILTTHASKGLEFDIVFNLGLIKRTKVETWLHHKKEGDICCLTPAEEGSFEKQIFCQELDAEKMRQFYVAMTRAKYRVYAPVLLFPEKTSSIESGEASPMELFLGRFGQPFADSAGLYERINHQSQDDFINYLSNNAPPNLISYSVLQKDETPLTPYLCEAQVFLEKPSKITIPGEARLIHSFTSLSKSFVMKAKGIPPHDYKIIYKNVHTLPVGSQTGNLLHQCLEHLNFAECKTIKNPKELDSFLYPFVRSTLFEEWKDVLLEILFSAVKTPFILGKNSLCDVLEGCLSKECEFLYEDHRAYIKGVMDLFFFHDGKYYLLDWKSRWLGENSLCYQEKSLQAAMEQNDYFLQALLYKKALEKYLKLIDPRPFEEIFGGIYYIFLRGLPDSQGIFWKK